MMNGERAGERVFANVDQALAERIISRSRENSKETGPGGMADPAAGNAMGEGGNTRRRGGSAPFLGIAAVVFALAFLITFILKRGGGRDG